MTTHENKINSIRHIALVVAVNGVFAVTVPHIAVGQGVPRINVAPSCKAAAAGYIGLRQEFESCVKSEESARDILVQQWSTFLAEDRGSCYRLTTTGTPGTYTELLTCLEMRRDARALPTQDEIRKTSAPPRPSRRSSPKAAPGPELPAATR
jgi:hypothetical protein